MAEAQKRVITSSTLTLHAVVVHTAARTDTGWTDPDTGKAAHFHYDDVQAILATAREVIETGLFREHPEPTRQSGDPR